MSDGDVAQSTERIGEPEQNLDEQVDYEDGGDDFNQPEYIEEATVSGVSQNEDALGTSDSLEKPKSRKDFPIVNGIYPNILFMSRFSLTTSKEDIRILCDKYGKTLDISIKDNIAFVDFENAEDAKRAKEECHHHAVLGSDSLICDFKKQKVFNAPRRRDDRVDTFRDRPRDFHDDRSRIVDRDRDPRDRQNRDKFESRGGGGDLRDEVKKIQQQQQSHYSSDPRGGYRDAPRDTRRPADDYRYPDQGSGYRDLDYGRGAPVPTSHYDDYRAAPVSRSRRVDDEPYRGPERIPISRDRGEPIYAGNPRDVPPPREYRGAPPRDDRYYDRESVGPSSRAASAAFSAPPPSYDDIPRSRTSGPPPSSWGSRYENASASSGGHDRDRGGARYADVPVHNDYSSRERPPAPSAAALSRERPPVSAEHHFSSRDPVIREDDVGGKRYDQRLDVPLQSNRRGPPAVSGPPSGGGYREAPPSSASYSSSRGSGYDDRAVASSSARYDSYSSRGPPPPSRYDDYPADVDPKRQRRY